MNSAGVVTALVGGALIGAGASLYLLFTGRLGGVGGIVAGLLQRPNAETGTKATFVFGLLAGGMVFAWLRPSAFSVSPASVPILLVAGVAVGFGTRLGGGCTSGHGICGVSRLSSRAIVATMTFMFAGAMVVLLRHILGGTP